ncbi:MAG: hypothetical protein ABWY79_01820 [Solirubrobacterales bacterium]
MPPAEYVEAAAAELERSGHAEGTADRELLAAACAIAQDKAQTLTELWPLIRFLFEPPVDDPKAWSKVMERDGVADALAASLEALRDAEPYDAARLEAVLGAVVEDLGAKPRDVYQPLRVAITGTTVSPGIFESLAVLGRERSLERVEAAISRLRAAPQASPG